MSSPLILLLSGVNLDQLGTRQPKIYGTATLDDHVTAARTAAEALGLRLEHVQSNRESALVEAIHAHRDLAAALIINPAAFTHYSWALADALAAFPGPKIELHLSNPQTREPWRHTSVISPVVTGTIAGFGGHGYRLAVDAAASCLA